MSAGEKQRVLRCGSRERGKCEAYLRIHERRAWQQADRCKLSAGGRAGAVEIGDVGRGEAEHADREKYIGKR